MSPRAYEIEAGGVDAVYLAHRKTAEERNLFGVVSNLLHVALVRGLSPFVGFSIDQCRQFAVGLRR